MSDYQTEDAEPKYGVRLNPEELAVLRESRLARLSVSVRLGAALAERPG